MSEQAEARIPEDGWETVADESPTRAVFDTVGEQFIGQFLSVDQIENPADETAPFEYIILRGTDGHLYSISAGYKLKQAFEKVTPGHAVRITYVKDVDMGDSRNPMKDYKVEARAPRA
jgi:hypothetical protein